MTPKAQDRLRDLVDKLTQAHEANPSDAALIMADAERRAWRTIQRGDVPDDMERVEIVQTRGPILEFTGKLVCKHEYLREHDDHNFIAELWETKGGNWVAVWDASDNDFIQAKYIALGDVIAAMDFWEWGSVARSLAKKLKWDLRVEIN